MALVTLVAGLAVGWLSARYRSQARVASAEADVARLDAALRVERATAEERATLAARTDTALRETFGALSAEALQRNNEAFVALAEARLGMARAAADGDLAQRRRPSTAWSDRCASRWTRCSSSCARSSAIEQDRIQPARADRHDASDV